MDIATRFFLGGIGVAIAFGVVMSDVIFGVDTPSVRVGDIVTILADRHGELVASDGSRSQCWLKKGTRAKVLSVSVSDELERGSLEVLELSGVKNPKDLDSDTCGVGPPVFVSSVFFDSDYMETDAKRAERNAAYKKALDSVTKLKSE